MRTDGNYIMKSDVYYNRKKKYTKEKLFYKNEKWKLVNNKLEELIEEQGLAEGILSHTELFRVYKNNRLVEIIQLLPSTN